MRLERWLAIHLLSAQIPPLNLRKARPEKERVRVGHKGRTRTIVSTLRDYLTSASLWKGLVLLVIKLPLIIVVFAIALIPTALTIGFALAPLLGYVNSGWAVQLTSGGAWVTGLMAIPSAIVTIGVLDGIRSVLRRLTTFFLSSPPRTDQLVRDSLAAGLGDESLTIAYWLPEREIFVDDDGHEVQISAATETGRVWTPVEHDGKLIAAIIHRPDLANTDIVQTAGTAAVLQLENERLRADLRARLDELRDSRARIVEVSNAERRRLERNLHDGAQQQLVALALQLRLARNKATNKESAELIDGALEQLDQALSELRELARGIHPAILSDRGLEAAVKALAERQLLPTEIEYSVERKLEPTVEATAYFMIAEGLANIAKYAEAKQADVRVREQEGRWKWRSPMTVAAAPMRAREAACAAWKNGFTPWTERSASRASPARGRASSPTFRWVKARPRRTASPRMRNDSGVRACVCLPTYNERENLEPMLRALGEVLGPDDRVLVIDDGSPDGSGEIAEGLKSGARLRRCPSPRAEERSRPRLHRRLRLGAGARRRAGAGDGLRLLAQSRRRPAPDRDRR